MVHQKTENIWTQEEDNPDFKLVTIHAANIGFQSKMDIVTGSYVITAFTRLMIQNIRDNNNKQWLFQIFDYIQKELHDKGKQHTVNTYNDGTRWIKFRKLKDDNDDFIDRRKSNLQISDLVDVFERKLQKEKSDTVNDDSSDDEEEDMLPKKDAFNFWKSIQANNEANQDKKDNTHPIRKHEEKQIFMVNGKIELQNV